MQNETTGGKILMLNTKLPIAKGYTKCETTYTLNMCGIMNVMITRSCGLSESQPNGLQTSGKVCVAYGHTQNVCSENRFSGRIKYWSYRQTFMLG